MADNEKSNHRFNDDERRRQKEMIKALETPEQKRQRRLAKKEEKERRRKRLMGWDDEYMGYTNEDNPFGDSNLHETFVWKKKYEKMGMKRIDEQEIDAVNKEKMIKNRQELEKVKKRRLEREHERELRMEELSKQQRDKEAEQFKEWAKQEDYFHLKQARLRSKLRIKEGRAKPIDILAQYINVFGENQTMEQKSELERIADEEASSDSSRMRLQQQRRDEEEEDLQDKIRYLSTYLAEPYNTLNGLRIREMEDLVEDIKIYLELDSGSKVNAEYWKDLQIIVDDELTKLKLANMDQQERRREGINPSVSADIARILKGKSPQQLKTLQIQIEKKIASREEGIDIGYWETLLSRLKAQIARARLREFHDENLKKRKSLIAQHQKDIKHLQPLPLDSMDMIETNQEDEMMIPSSSTSSTTAATTTSTMNRNEKDEMEFLSKAELRQKCIQDYESGGYSPRKFPLIDINSDFILMSAEDFEHDLQEKRTETLRKLAAFPIPLVAFDGKQKSNITLPPQAMTNYDHNDRKLTKAEESFVREARKGMGDDEAIFSVEEEPITSSNSIVATNQHHQLLMKEKYSWAEKYRPRKPRYFNRVHTGFEWNKYNQTHYDVDNPPPKVVQGYKFNIFYPDLIDKSTTPSYKIITCKDNPEFAYIRFTAGPPYEDICFKIVNREWNYSYKSGFRCQFQNNILQLWFHFKRYRYRR